MNKIIGLRKENKGPLEKRAPLTPKDVKILIDKNIKIIIESSDNRVFKDNEYSAAGAEIVSSLELADIILGIKEVKEKYLYDNKIYIFFSHVIKGQSYNMTMLKKILERKIILFDYEEIKNSKNQRLVFFGRYAGLAGAIDTLWAAGRKYDFKNIDTPFKNIKRANSYNSLTQAKEAIKEVGNIISNNNLPNELTPFVIGFVGYGHVSKGAQEIFENLPVKEISPQELLTLNLDKKNMIYKVVFHEKDMVKNKDKNKPFDLNEYYQYPQRYEGIFRNYLPKLSIIINGTYWDNKYPKHISKEEIKNIYTNKNPKLKIICDISCDIEGGVEITKEVRMPDDPVYSYNPDNDSIENGYKGYGPLVVAVDILPSELPRESSQEFSRLLSNYIPHLLKTDFSQNFQNLSLIPELKNAIITYKGNLTEKFKYITKYLKG